MNRILKTCFPYFKKDELLLLITKNTDTQFEQTKIKPQKTLQLKMIKTRETLSIGTALILEEEGKWMLDLIG